MDLDEDIEEEEDIDELQSDVEEMKTRVRNLIPLVTPTWRVWKKMRLGTSLDGAMTHHLRKCFQRLHWSQAFTHS
jgi:hypothetical protein